MFLPYFAAQLSNLRTATDLISFVHYELLSCDHNGLHYAIEDHDITLSIPKGAVAEGEKVHFAVGAAMYGPFKFPDNTQLVSPIIWLHLLEENTKLNKRFQLIVPHCYYSKSVASPDQISFATADDRLLRDITNNDSRPHYLLKLLKAGKNCYINCAYGVILTDMWNQMFCIVKHTSKYGHWCQDISFLLARVDLQLSSTMKEFHFYGLFDLATHRKVY